MTTFDDALSTPLLPSPRAILGGDEGTPVAAALVLAVAVAVFWAVLLERVAAGFGVTLGTVAQIGVAVAIALFLAPVLAALMGGRR